MASSHAGVRAVPADYGELFLEYGPEIRRMVRRHLGPAAQPGDVDDGVQYIFGQFIKNKAIEQYQPGYINDYNHKPTTFQAFILAKVPLYCRGLRESLHRRLGRELQYLDADGENGAADAIASATDEYPSLAGQDMDRLRERLAGYVPEPGGEPVLPLFEALAERFEQGQSVSADAVRRQFGKTRDEANAWFAALKDALREPAPAAPEPEPVVTGEDETAAWFRRLYAAGGGFKLGGITLSAEEVRAALDALRASRGNRVLPAFTGTGHRLQGAGKTWYLAFADDVMETYPELRTPVRRHAEGHFGRVKNALVFGLARLLGDAVEVLPVTVPVDEAVASAVDDAVDESAVLWEQLESVIARLPGFGEANVEAAVEAVRLLSLAPA